MAPEDLLLRLDRAYTGAEMRGWDFSVLDGRLDAEDPPWDFEADCLAALRHAGRVGPAGEPGQLIWAPAVANECVVSSPACRRTSAWS